MQLMKYLLSIIFFIASFFVFSRSASANLSFNGGEYTNICGSGLTATSHACNNSCNPTTGTCSQTGNTVVRFVCDGRQTQCNQNESSFSSSQSFGNPGCDKTVALITFNKTCRVNGGWTCGDGDMTDYIVWYSGSCANQTSQTQNSNSTQQTNTVANNPAPAQSQAPVAVVQPAAIAQQSSCDNLEVTGGNNSLVPATVTLRASGSDNKGNIQGYRYYFGDGQQVESSNNQIQHQYTSSGSFIARADVKDTVGNWKTSSACETTVSVQSAPIESHKSACSNVYITANNSAIAPSTVTFEVTGYDNKGSLQNYRVDFGNGVVKDGTGSHFEQVYNSTGTFDVKAYVQDTQGNWVGGSGTCEQSLAIGSATPLKSQPSTGIETVIPVAGAISGSIGLALQVVKRRLTK